MGGLITALSNGKTSLATTQKNIEVTGNNIANVNTPGYSKQRTQLGQIPSLDLGGFFIGQGVTVETISRDYNVFITRQLHDKTIDYGEENGKSLPLTELERVFSISSDNLASEMDRFFDSWQQLTINPSNMVDREAVLQRGALLGNAFNKVSNELDAVQQNINNTLESKVGLINEKLQGVAELNDRIKRIEISGHEANSFRDQRDVLLQDLSEMFGAKHFTDANDSLSVHMPGGLPLVSDTKAFTFESYTVAGDKAFRINYGNNTKNLLTQDMSGELRGMLDVRDITLTNARNDLDVLALDLTEAVNTVHNGGWDLNNNNNIDFFVDLGGVVSGAARSVQMAITDYTMIAAAGNAAAAPGDNENALLLAELENTNTVAATSETFSGYFSGIVSDIGLEASRNKLALGGAEDAMNQLETLREGFSGVSLEEEMVSLIQFQRSFESSAKFLSIVDEMMAAVIALKS